MPLLPVAIYIHTNNCTVIRYDDLQTCGKSPACFSFLGPSSVTYSKKKNACDYLHLSLFFFDKYLPEIGRRRPKHVGGLPHVRIPLYIIVMQVLVCNRGLSDCKENGYF